MARGPARRRAQGKYHDALQAAPAKAAQQRATYAANKAAVQMKRDNWKEAVRDCSEALELDPGYIKALLRRAAAYERLEDLEHCLADYEKARLPGTACLPARSSVRGRTSAACRRVCRWLGPRASTARGAGTAAVAAGSTLGSLQEQQTPWA